MAIVVEDGTGLSNANSYASAAECTAYWADRISATWTAANAAQKTAALIKATSFVDGRYFGRFLGRFPVASTQALQWPRVDAVDQRGYQLTGVPAALKAAVYEAAVLFLGEDLTAAQERGGAVKRVKVGPVEQEFADNAPQETSYPAIEQAVRPLLVATGSSSVRLGRA